MTKQVSDSNNVIKSVKNNNMNDYGFEGKIIDTELAPKQNETPNVIENNVFDFEDKFNTVDTEL